MSPTLNPWDPKAVFEQVSEARRQEPRIVSLGAEPRECCGRVSPITMDFTDDRTGYYKCLCGRRYHINHHDRTWTML